MLYIFQMPKAQEDAQTEQNQEAVHIVCLTTKIGSQGTTPRGKQPCLLGSSNGHISCDMPVIIMHIYSSSKNFKLELSAIGEKWTNFQFYFNLG